MKKELPKVYANSISKQFNNTQELYYGSRNHNDSQISLNDIIKKINEIFNSPNHVYKSTVLININGREEEKVIVGKNSNSLFTLEGEIIGINSIHDIKKRS